MSETPTTPATDDVSHIDPSIVDTILDLDELLSSDVRRAEATARFSIKPWLEGEIEELERELDDLTDGSGKPAGRGEASLADEGPSAAFLKAEEIQAKRQEYAESFRSVRVEQLSSDDWLAFNQKHRKALDSPPPYPAAMWDELIAACAIAPKMPLEKVQALRKKIGQPQMHEIASKCWQANTEQGVSVPKSPLSSHVLRLQRPAPN